MRVDSTGPRSSHPPDALIGSKRLSSVQDESRVSTSPPVSAGGRRSGERLPGRPRSLYLRPCNGGRARLAYSSVRLGPMGPRSTEVRLAAQEGFSAPYSAPLAPIRVRFRARDAYSSPSTPKTLNCPVIIAQGPKAVNPATGHRPPAASLRPHRFHLPVRFPVPSCLSKPFRRHLGRSPLYGTDHRPLTTDPLCSGRSAGPPTTDRSPLASGRCLSVQTPPQSAPASDVATGQL
jgi:hypothetical protein